MKMLKLNVKTKDKSYSVIIGDNIITKINLLLKDELNNCEKIAIIMDSNLPKKHLKVIKNQLNKFTVFITKIKTNEKIKNINTSLKIVDDLLIKNFNRNDCIIALGGGIVGDLSGFAASILKRGIKFINIPTTLLSQVDSCIGGKTGVNSKFGKNLIGTFYQPNLVLSDINLLYSLPKRELICGYAEILKHSLILNKKFFIWLNKNGKKILNLENKKLLQKAIYESCKIKIAVIENDEKESNLRQILNFGHTFGHAFEATKKFSKIINHGEAVLYGMICASKFSFSNNLLNYNELNTIINHYKSLNLPFNLKKKFKKNNTNQILKFMKNDKKNINNKIKLVLIKRIGKSPSLISFPIKKIKKFLLSELN